MLTTYFTLLIAHFIGDFPLQSGKIYDLKVSSNLGLGLHVGIHLAVSMVLIAEPFRWWWVFLLLGVSHFITDWIKLRVKTKPQWTGFVLDQFAHWLMLGPLVWLAPAMKSILPEKWIRLDIGLILIPAILLFTWVIAFDKYPETDTTPRRILWIKNRGLAVSQAIGMATTLFIAIQVLGIL